MICDPCKRANHGACPEASRQLRYMQGGTGGMASLVRRLHRATGQLCDCAHEPGTVLRPDRKPDPRRGA